MVQGLEQSLFRSDGLRLDKRLERNTTCTGSVGHCMAVASRSYYYSETIDIYVHQFSIETLNLSLRATSSITQIVVHNRTMTVTEQEQLPTVGADTSKAATGVHALIGTLCQPVPATMQT